jgi:hypothetical protein
VIKVAIFSVRGRQHCCQLDGDKKAFKFDLLFHYKKAKGELLKVQNKQKELI